MKLSKTICISKKAVLYITVLFLIIGFLFLISSRVETQKQIVSSKAAPLKYIGGVPVKKGEYPAVAYLSNGCTAVLISSRWLLTAAHCAVQNEQYNRLFFENDFYATVGVVDASNEVGFNFDGIKISTPPILWGYNKVSKKNDIALLLLDSEVKLSTYPSLPEPGKDENLYVADKNADCENNDKCVIGVGWGCSSVLPTPTGYINPTQLLSIRNSLEVFNNKLNKLELPIYNLNTGTSSFYFGYDDNRALSKSMCSGDSGSPLFSKKKANYVIGIAWGSESGFEQRPGAATKVINFTKRIQQEIAKTPTLIPAPTIKPAKEKRK